MQKDPRITAADRIYAEASVLLGDPDLPTKVRTRIQRLLKKATRIDAVWRATGMLDDAIAVKSDDADKTLSDEIEHIRQQRRLAHLKALL